MTNANKPTAIVVCPGRGGYNKPELGSITRKHPLQTQQLQAWDNARKAASAATVSELDQAARFDFKQHLHAENSAALIYAAGYLDFMALERDYEVVAITGNSMGWYTALACAGVWEPTRAMTIVTDMARNTADAKGAQLIFPLVDSNWKPLPAYHQAVQQVLQQHPQELFESIHYGGYILLSGTEHAIQAAAASLPRVDERFPLILPGHAAFHSPLMGEAVNRALAHWPVDEFRQPQRPLIDGRGVIWQPPAVDLGQLRDYTFHHQVAETYDFTRALQVSINEFAPDNIVLLGPGNSLGGATGQTLAAMGWRGINDKDSFTREQEQGRAPVVSLGLA
ncbi:malonyl CoA-ACP transacylase [Idiomarina sp. OT37-5b]|jgi:acyl transferase domain-containing protein|uniref:malonyl CoA-ACP transacylase n=1 Tax=Idiomarina sp. OT37-5b TaxID=2100422 RepID=UPI000CF8B2C5|nr:malonyl CoA-ACP transacylase [Idiomarina sp. OT37-5b]AVJ54900.1 malonyl CoA-ACP transacylase [Idiomarina sp. OT37-5b]